MQPSHSLPLESFEDHQKFKVHRGDTSDDIVQEPGALEQGRCPLFRPLARAQPQTPPGQQQGAVCSWTSRCPSLGLSGLKVKSLFQRRMLCFCPELSGHTCWFLWFVNGRVCEAPWAGLLELTQS